MRSDRSAARLSRAFVRLVQFAVLAALPMLAPGCRTYLGYTTLDRKVGTQQRQVLKTHPAYALRLDIGRKPTVDDPSLSVSVLTVSTQEVFVVQAMEKVERRKYIKYSDLEKFFEIFVWPFALPVHAFDFCAKLCGFSGVHWKIYEEHRPDYLVRLSHSLLIFSFNPFQCVYYPEPEYENSIEYTYDLISRNMMTNVVVEVVTNPCEKARVAILASSIPDMPLSADTDVKGEAKISLEPWEPFLLADKPLRITITAEAMGLQAETKLIMNTDEILGRTSVVSAEAPVVRQQRLVLPKPTWELETIAVAPLTAEAIAKTEVDTLTETLSSCLVESKYFRVLARNDMAKVLKEQQFSPKQPDRIRPSLHRRAYLLRSRRVRRHLVIRQRFFLHS